MNQLASDLRSSTDATRNQNAGQIGAEFATHPLFDRPADVSLPLFADFGVDRRSVHVSAVAVNHHGYGVSCAGGESSLTYYQPFW